MQATDFKTRKEGLEDAGKVAVESLVTYFINRLTYTAGIHEQTIVEIRDLVTYNLMLMIENPENAEASYAEFYQSAIVSFSQEQNVPIDYEKLERLWQGLLAAYRRLYQLITEEWESAIERDASVEEEIRAVDLNDTSPTANATFKKEKLVLIAMDAAFATREKDEILTVQILTEIGQTNQAPLNLEARARSDGKGKEITHEKLYDMMYHKKFPAGCDRLIVIDSRFPFEYQAGHIHGALNYWNYKKALSFFQPSVINNYSTTVFVFHCEFSSSRGPGLAQCFRDLAQKLTRTIFGRTDMEREYERFSYQPQEGEPGFGEPQLPVEKYDYFRNIYILKDGYKKFFSVHPELCTPRFYLREDTYCRKNQDKYCQTVQTRGNKKSGQKGNFASTFMTDAEYVNWSECWIQDRKSTATITEAEYSFRFANDDDDEQQEEVKEGEEEPKEEKQHRGDVTTTTTTLVHPEPAQQVPPNLPPLVGDEEEEDEYEFYRQQIRRRGRGPPSGRTPQKRASEDQKGKDSKRGRK